MPERIEADVVLRISDAAAPSLSADGSHLAYVWTRVDQTTRDYHSTLEIIGIDDDFHVAIDGGGNVRDPQISPDGETVAFLTSDDDGTRQIFTVGIDGADVTQITKIPRDVTDISWSPDGARIAFSSDYDERSVEPQTIWPQVRVTDRLKYRTDGVGWRGDTFSNIFVVDLDSGIVDQRTEHDGDDRRPRFSPDGKSIGFISDRGVDRELLGHTSIQVIDAFRGDPQSWTRDLTAARAFAWSPDSSTIAVIGSDDAGLFGSDEGGLYLIDVTDAPARRLTSSLRDDAHGMTFPEADPSWHRNGKIFFASGAEGRTQICSVRSDGTGFNVLTDESWWIAEIEFASEWDFAIVAANEPGSVGELFVADLDLGTHRRLTANNDTYFTDHRPARLEKFSRRRNGLHIESRLWLPDGFDPDRQYPLVLDVHGGPHSLFRDTFEPRQHILASAGYIVLAVNPRGSSGYGPQHLKAVAGDWAGEDTHDIVDALDVACELAYVDGSRLGIHGYSYGGFMAAWMIGHGDRFSAAVIGAPVTNLVSMYGTSDIGVRFGEQQWAGSLMDSIDWYVERSPLSYVSAVDTPALFLHGEDDIRCPIDQSEQFFVALRRLDKRAEFVRFPNSSHSMLREGHPELRRQYLQRMLDWFETYIPKADG